MPRPSYPPLLLAPQNPHHTCPPPRAQAEADLRAAKAELAALKGELDATEQQAEAAGREVAEVAGRVASVEEELRSDMLAQVRGGGRGGWSACCLQVRVGEGGLLSLLPASAGGGGGHQDEVRVRKAGEGAPLHSTPPPPGRAPSVPAAQHG